jgi:flagellar biosynthesis protein FlhG
MMRDQAERLRELVKNSVEEVIESEKQTRVIAITSGKGGVGKTNLAINIGIALSEQGARVALMDADLGLANIDVLLGILPEYTLKDAFEGTAEIEQILCEGPSGLQIIPGGSGVQEMADISEEKLGSFIESLQQVEHLFDYILIDTGAGISRTVTSFLFAADHCLLVTTPEPTSITDAYAMIKTMLRSMSHEKISLIVNRAEDYNEARETHRKLNMAVKAFLGGELNFCGWVVDDSLFKVSAKNHTPLLKGAMDSAAARMIKQIAKSIHTSMQGLVEEVVPSAEATSGISGFFSKLKKFFKS